jgi:cysteine protease ATG4
MTYRKNIDPLFNSKYVSDTGWGCMIRVGQMVLAQVLKKLLKDETNEKVICYFIDNIHKSDIKNQGLFSIQNIAEAAYLDFNLKAGEWYKPTHIL